VNSLRPDHIQVCQLLAAPLFRWLPLGEALSPQQSAGCGLIAAEILLHKLAVSSC